MTFDIVENNIVKAHPGSSNSVVIPSNVLSINDGTDSEYAFIEFKNIKFSLSFSLNSKLTRIGKYAFSNCQQLTLIDFKNANSLNSIGSYAFRYCTSLTSLHFPSSLELMNEFGTFSNCINVEEAIFPDDSKIKTIYAGAFNFNYKLTRFRVPSSCTSLNGETFGMTSIEKFSIQEGNTAYKEYNGSIFSFDLKTLIVHRKSGELSLPPQTTSIGYIALSNFRSDIKFRKNITIFNQLSIYSYQGKRITMLGVINCISARMFEYCSNLIEVKFYNEVNIIKMALLNIAIS